MTIWEGWADVSIGEPELMFGITFACGENCAACQIVSFSGAARNLALGPAIR
jgi:hypothetical protein